MASKTDSFNGKNQSMDDLRDKAQLVLNTGSEALQRFANLADTAAGGQGLGPIAAHIGGAVDVLRGKVFGSREAIIEDLDESLRIIGSCIDKLESLSSVGTDS